MWTPFCTKKANFRHDESCLDVVACPYCGQPNPNSEDNSVVVIPDTPPARQSLSLPARSLAFPLIDPIPGAVARRTAVVETRGEGQMRPHAGFPINSVRPRATALGKGNRLGLAKKALKLVVTIYVGTAQNRALRIYNEWTHISKYVLL
jgi:uncharacterized protein YbaR (Trm112 family)